MAINTQTKTGLVGQMVTAVQSWASGFVDFAIGSIPLAVVEAVADVALWLQGLIIYLLTITRAATSTGSNLDTWLADFGYTRAQAIAATVNLTFGRYNSSGATYVPVGASVQSADGSQIFIVGTNIANGAYSATAGGAGVPGYVLGIGTATVANVPAAASAASAASNVLAGTLVVITSPITGIDYVTNPTAAISGANAATDTQARAGFVTYLALLARATPAAVAAAAAGVAGVQISTVLENTTIGGTYLLGSTLVVIDDGSGTPSAALQAAVAAAVNLVRPLNSITQVSGPSVVSAAVVVSVKVATGYNAASVASAVQAAITSYINATGFLASLPYTRISQIAYDASAGVANATGETLAGGTADLVATGTQLIRTTSVTINTY